VARLPVETTATDTPLDKHTCTHLRGNSNTSPGQMRFSVTATALGFAAVCGLVAAAPTAVSSAQPYEETNAEQSLPFSPGPITTTTVFDDEHGFRNISYFVKDGDVIVESDIIFGTVQDLRQGEANAQKAMESGVQIARRAYVKVNLPWYGATVRYKWATPGSKANYKNEVEDAIARWKANASYLHFQEVGTGYNGDQWNPVLTIYGEGEIGCFSSVGYTPGVTSRMQLGTGCGTAEATHEFGHVLGTDQLYSCPSSSTSHLANTCPRPSTRAHPPRPR